MNTTDNKTDALKSFLTDEQILECMILFETRKIDAARKLSAYMFPKWNITTIDAIEILKAIQKEWSTNTPK